MIAVLDYGMGNLRSVEKALEHVGADVEITYDPHRIRAASGLVLDDLIRERRAQGVPVLGICLGMQLLFERSVELGGASGLALLPGEVRALDAPGLKIPQIGWNAVAWQQQSPLVEGLPDPAAFYHVHSFAPVASNGVVLGTAEYGNEFVSAVAGDGVWGVQFHPEKSGPDGLALLGNFLKLAQ